jgi:hypothetical protein
MRFVTDNTYGRLLDARSSICFSPERTTTARTDGTGEN